jgi:hypothetical protein
MSGITPAGCGPPISPRADEMIEYPIEHLSAGMPHTARLRCSEVSRQTVASG